MKPTMSGILVRVSIAIGTVAAAALIFMAGVGVGRSGEGSAARTAAVQPVSPGGTSYMLLLYSNNDPVRADRPAGDPEAGAAIVEEYRAWGERMEEEGRLVSAEKLKDDVLVLTPAGGTVKSFTDGERVLGGYFLIRARNLDQARQLALTHPHLKYGGEIEIRPLDLHD